MNIYIAPPFFFFYYYMLQGAPLYLYWTFVVIVIYGIFLADSNATRKSSILTQNLSTYSQKVHGIASPPNDISHTFVSHILQIFVMLFMIVFAIQKGLIIM